MKKKGIWTHAGIVLVVAVLFGIGIVKAQSRTVSHSAVTTYTDGSLIEPGNEVTYSVWMQDNVTKTISQISNRVPATVHSFNDSGLVKGRVYNFWAGAFLAVGGASDNSAVYAWTVPLGKSSPPQGLIVQ